MTELVCSNPNEFALALKKLIGGGRVIIPAGIEPYNLKMYAAPGTPNLQFLDRLEIVGEPGAKAQAIGWQNAANISIEGIEVINPGFQYCISFGGCRDISIKNCPSTRGYDPYVLPQEKYWNNGVNIRGCRDVSVDSCNVTRVGTGFGVLDSIGVSITNCTMKETLADCMNIGSNVQDLVISDNTFFGQAKVLNPAHHYDMLQFWCQTDARMDTKNVKVLRNRFFAPDEAVTPQSIFGRADYGTNPFKFQDFEVAYNMIYSRHANAIRFAEVDNIDVHHNVLTYAGIDPWTSNSVYVPGILLQMATNHRVHHNVFPKKYGYPSIDTPEFFKNTVYEYQK